ncbi:hypothetical protein HBH70_205830 [Parastagonospora nodorum]|nr:hypothetical protein HBH51_206580 [Parastagonospora nodorum]KAH4113789.1 hypothetical protein HBH47_204400 [Parastagonospora nodorum]KAH4154344.1 hypothetical protein HBH43_218280 [Parastagonospora nodorum]KAH4181764.1 hypothetical protein HBH42_230570 [Parastagonospora nodorum]KAH4216011.1 hypothetical protein HBI06_238230 [Parastagonospora nodorum]
MATNIIPGARYEPFRGHFVITPIHNAVYYEALSYTWGDPAQAGQFLINGEALPVTENLANVLEYLRMLQGRLDLRIWIDQICIDQGDVIERGRQVAMMRLIYSKAECVRIWIDAPGLKDTSEVVKTLKTFQFQDSESNFGLGNDLHVWVPLRGMFHSGYWKRLWM